MSVPEYIFDDPVAILRTLIVGVLAYVSLVAILRISGKRTLTQMNAFDFVVTVALGSTLATLLLSREVALAEGVVAMGLLVLLQFAIAWTSQRSRTIARLVKSEPTALVYRGEVLNDALRRERVLEVELFQALRHAGVASVKDVDLVVLETNGAISIVTTLPEKPVALSPVVGLPESAGPADSPASRRS